MRRRTFLSTAITGYIGVRAVEHTADGVEIEEVASGLTHPWGMAFLPNDSRMLVTERDGRLSLLDRESGALESVEGTPDVYAVGQGGLFDVALHPDFPDDDWLYLTYAATNDDDEAATHLGRGRLEADEQRLGEFEELFVAEPFADWDGLYGSSAVFGADGTLYMTVGSRGYGDGPDHAAQDTTNALGTTIRLEPDGSIPADNPFVGEEDAQDAIYSYGHRNAQGMTVHPETGAIWQSEHGEEDGDEINVLEAGGNYGWPIATYSCEYETDEPMGDEPHERDDMVAPVYYWECGSGGFPPGGMTFYDGDAFPDWDGDLFVGSLGGLSIGRFAVDGTDVEEVERLLDVGSWRIRDVENAPDTGYLYVLVDFDDAPVLRLVPE